MYVVIITTSCFKIFRIACSFLDSSWVKGGGGAGVDNWSTTRASWLGHFCDVRMFLYSRFEISCSFSDILNVTIVTRCFVNNVRRVLIQIFQLKQ